MMDKNKVKYNLKNVHYAKITAMAEDGTPTYEKPVRWPGAVSMSFSPNGNPEIFWADGEAYYTTNNNYGYEGDFESAIVPESFVKDILGEESDKNGVLVENANAELGRFALLFEFDGDQKKIRHVLHNCTASRANVESATKEESVEVKTDTITITAKPLANGLVKVKTGDTTTDDTYNGWYNAVYMPVLENSSTTTD